MRPSLLLLTASLAAAVSSSGASAQALKPGMTDAKLFVTNKTRDEAVPVSIANVDPKAPPVPVAAIGTVVTELSQTSMKEIERLEAAPRPVTARSQPWEYRESVFDATADRVTALNSLGASGWEAVGLSTLADGRTLVLLKRPRNDP